MALRAERAYWLAWSRIKDVGPVTIKRLWEHFGSLALAWRASAGELLEVDGIGLLSAEKIVALRPKLEDPEKLLVQHEQENVAFWTPADPDYPALLFAINDPPPLLYYRGKLRLNDVPNALTVGMVGTRRPSAYGKRWTQRLSTHLTRQGALIVSGLAAGIDTEAHTSCLHSQGLTVAVLGTGVDVVYPKQNQGLYNQIVSAGLVVSEYPDGTLPDRAHFPQRNRIIAGLSRAILVTEAPARSGALITSRLANEYCREVYALPCSLDNVQGEGCLRAIEQGAQMILGEQVLAEALAMLPPMAVPFPGQVVAAEALPVEDLGASNGTLMAEGAGRSPVAAVGTTASTRSTVSSAAPSAVSAAVSAAVSSAATASPVAVAQPDLSAVIEGLSPTLRQVFDAVPIEPAVLDYIVPLVPMTPGEVMGALVQLELLGLVSQLPGMHYQRV